MNTIAELAHYYTALKHSINVSPSAMVYKAWHAHILNTPMYMEFTKAEFDHSSDGTEEDVYIHLNQKFAVIWN